GWWSFWARSRCWRATFRRTGRRGSRRWRRSDTNRPREGQVGPVGLVGQGGAPAAMRRRGPQRGSRVGVQAVGPRRQWNKSRSGGSSDMTELIRGDLRYAFRTLIRNPGFTLVAVLTMAIGIGATTAIFSIVDPVLLRPLPFADPDALVLVSQANRQTRQSSGDATPANFLDWRSRNRT